MRLVFCVTLLLLLFKNSAAQHDLIVSGPMLGYVEHREVAIWIETTPDVKTLQLNYWKKDGKKKTLNYTGELGKNYNPVKFILSPLDMNTDYNYEIIANNKPQQFTYPLTFHTKKLWEWREPAPDFSFLIGSCLYVNDSLYDRNGKPYGQSPKILETMANTPSDFMIWGGDNTYLREADFSSESGIKYRYQHTRKIPEMQKLLASRPHYATWDDHDYGPNDGNATYQLKDASTACFKNYWANQTFGENGNGIYSKFLFSDVEFFLLDDRTFRSANELPDSIDGKPNANKKYLGEQQLNWLKNALISSQSNFKFIVCGGQILNPYSFKECFTYFPYEWNELMDFIIKNNISGIVFFSGDRHFSEIIERKMDGFYPLYDITSSSITATNYPLNKKELNNPYRVAGTHVGENNFIKVSVSGAKKNREITIESYNAKGEKKFTYSIPESKLKIAKKD